MLATPILWLNAGVFFLYGVAFALFPAEMAEFVTGGSPSTASGLIDLRSTYGGMSMGIGALFAFAARDASLHRIGLRGVLAVMLGMGGARAIGIVVDGNPNAWMFVYLALEVGMAGASGWALRGRRG